MGVFALCCPYGVYTRWSLFTSPSLPAEFLYDGSVSNPSVASVSFSWLNFRLLVISDPLSSPFFAFSTSEGRQVLVGFISRPCLSCLRLAFPRFPVLSTLWYYFNPSASSQAPFSRRLHHFVHMTSRVLCKLGGILNIGAFLRII